MPRILFICFVAIALLRCTSLPTDRLPATSSPFLTVVNGSLFASRQPLNIEIDAPLKNLLSQRSIGFPKYKEASVIGKMSYNNDQNRKVEIPVDIHIKGFSTSSGCPFPKLELKFKSGEREGTLFARMTSVDLNTHCGEESDATVDEYFKTSFYNHREAMIYHMAEILEIPTFKARRVFVHYRNTEITSVDQNPESYRAFFLEDMADFRKRLNAKEIRGTEDPLKQYTLTQDPGKASQYVFSDLQSAPQMDLEDAARIALFQAMIGNTDWFIKTKPQSKRSPNDKTNLWNTKIVELPGGKWVLFPQDFNLAAMVFGYPINGFPINKINGETFAVVDKPTQLRLKQNFIDKKSQLYKLLETLTKDSIGHEGMKKTLDNFYTTLGSY